MKCERWTGGQLSASRVTLCVVLRCVMLWCYDLLFLNTGSCCWCGCRHQTWAKDQSELNFSHSTVTATIVGAIAVQQLWVLSRLSLRPQLGTAAVNSVTSVPSLPSPVTPMELEKTNSSVIITGQLRHGNSCCCTFFVVLFWCCYNPPCHNVQWGMFPHPAVHMWIVVLDRQELTLLLLSCCSNMPQFSFTASRWRNFTVHLPWHPFSSRKR